MTLQELEAHVDGLRATWRNDAQARTARFRALGRYDEQGQAPIWGAIKEIYMRLQHNKCAYCETLLQGPPYGKVDNDIEHYRPKGGVKKWPSPTVARQRKLTYQFQTGPAWEEGYYLLAYHLLNYVTACKPCNQILKRDYFPIYKSRSVQSDVLDDYRAEQPLLIYPLGDIDDDPEDLITFEGIIAIPKKTSGYPNYRARVTIDFFDLNGRESLRRGRAKQIRELWSHLRISQNDPDPAERQRAHEDIEDLLSPSNPHTNCTRAFFALYQHDPQGAEAYYEAARHI